MVEYMIKFNVIFFYTEQIKHPQGSNYKSITLKSKTKHSSYTISSNQKGLMFSKNRFKLTVVVFTSSEIHHLITLVLTAVVCESMCFCQRSKLPYREYQPGFGSQLFIKLFRVSVSLSVK